MSQDEIVEPARARFVPCYDSVREAALASGALGFAISGAGPSMIALARDKGHAERLSRVMKKACYCCDNPISKAARTAPGALEVGRGG